ncbi:MAG TPA: TIGR01777 family oxidoreductase [Acidimicrobiia bacterium]|nr:TIGR01777 family oxidoreductase [Acidimicrobiia bacterium]
MKVLVTGATGLIGTALCDALRERDDLAIAITRGRHGPGELSWDPERGELEADRLEGADAIVHLAGESIGNARWTPETKRRILESRTKGTTLLAKTVASLVDPPRVLVSGSAIGYYGDRGDDVLTEESVPGGGFLSDVAVRWEESVAAADQAGIRTVRVRTGIVLAREGGALARLLLPFKLGLGGRIGSGRQWMSWIALEDEVGAILHAIDHEDVIGAMNATAPNPVTNRDFTETLGHVLNRPTKVPTPLTALKLRYGDELVRELLCSSQRVEPRVLHETGYTFRHPRLADALHAALA